MHTVTLRCLDVGGLRFEVGYERWGVSRWGRKAGAGLNPANLSLST